MKKINQYKLLAGICALSQGIDLCILFSQFWGVARWKCLLFSAEMASCGIGGFGNLHGSAAAFAYLLHGLIPPFVRLHK